MKIGTNIRNLREKLVDLQNHPLKRELIPDKPAAIEDVDLPENHFET